VWSAREAAVLVPTALTVEMTAAGWSVRGVGGFVVLVISTQVIGWLSTSTQKESSSCCHATLPISPEAAPVKDARMDALAKAHA
jgi:hypothetical protein